MIRHRGTFYATESGLGSIRSRLIETSSELYFRIFSSFSETVAENIMVKRPLSGQQRKDAETALQKADMLERINDLPNKMDTLVGREFAPDGAVFSGGETQKLAIARAIAKDAPVLILDEPSSALDPIAENKCLKRFLTVSGIRR